MSTEEMSLEDLICAVDDFCRLFLPDWHRQQLQHGMINWMVNLLAVLVAYTHQLGC
jgi:hypothetical protein